MVHAPSAASEHHFTRSAPIHEVSNTQLACALITLGFDCSEKDSGAVRLVGDGITSPGGQVMWMFPKTNRDGSLTFAEVAKKWSDREWLTATDNEHPLAYIACFSHNYRKLLDKIHKQTPLGVIRKGKKQALVDLNASPHLQDIIAARL